MVDQVRGLPGIPDRAASAQGRGSRLDIPERLSPGHLAVGVGAIVFPVSPIRVSLRMDLYRFGGDLGGSADAYRQSVGSEKVCKLLL